MEKKILVVDDDKEFLEELQETLTLSGYEVKAISDPRKALAVAMQLKPDIIVLDLKMPGMTGFEVVNKIKSTPVTEHIPIIAMSGFFTAEQDDSLLSFFQIHHYLRKPFNPLDIIARIEEVFKETAHKRH
ncbi:MAG: response regulator [Candidatus Omnitrophica bacterium]|nr:response regulator [Candidatus Omnitrophota bacterium]